MHHFLENGNKLCGADARTYCEGFVEDGDSVQTVDACRAVGVERKSDEDLQAEAEAAEMKPLDDGEEYIAALGELGAGVQYVEAYGDRIVIVKAIATTSPMLGARRLAPCFRTSTRRSA